MRKIGFVLLLIINLVIFVGLRVANILLGWLFWGVSTGTSEHWYDNHIHFPSLLLQSSILLYLYYVSRTSPKGNNYLIITHVSAKFKAVLKNCGILV